MLKKLTSGYYSKMLLICIVTVCTVTVTLFLLSNSLIERQETTEYLKNYDMELNNLSSILAAKQNSMANNLSPLFSSTARYDALCTLMQKGSDTTSSIYPTVVQMLNDICSYDQYCRGILLLSRNGRFYQYTTNSDTLTPLKLSKHSVSFTPYQLQILSDAQISSLSAAYESSGEPVYGLVGTISGYSDEKLTPFGHMIILYSTSEFTNSILSTPGSSEGLFTITDKEQQIIFASDGNYRSADNLIIPEITPSGNNTVQLPAAKSMLGNTAYYHASALNGRYDYYTNYQIPASLISKGKSQIILAALALFICLASILLYVITLRTSNRKIKVIQQGMSLVGQNNLDYRLRTPKSNDEFTQITHSFNRMCDELQLNVEKAYLYELSQKKAEIYAMQTSINPHFLYNTLEQIRVQIMHGQPSDASHMLLLLSKMYRNQTRRNLYISIGEELNFCENLINLYMYRFGNFDYEFIIGNAVKLYGIPKNTLQPLIENYFAHGLVAERDDNYLTIRVEHITEDGADWLNFQVEDNGASITAEELAALEEKLAEHILNREEDNGFALSNVNTRLKLVFGDASGLRASVGSGGQGFRISFKIPPILVEDL